MHGVGVVGGDHEAPADKAMVFFGAEAEGEADALQHVPQETGVRALAAAASDLFVVEDAVDGNAVLGLRLQKAQEGTVAALEIVQPGGREKFFLRAPETRSFPDTEVQIRTQNALRHGGQPGSQLRPEHTGIAGFTDKREQIGLGVQGLLLILVPGQMRGEGGDDQKILFRPDQAEAQVIAFIQQHAPGKGERAVHPAAVHRAAVAFHVQPQKTFVQHPGTGLDLIRRGIAVGGDQVKAPDLAFRKTEGEHGGAVAFDIVFPAGDKGPAVFLMELGKTGVVQFPLQIGNRMEGGGAVCQKVQKFFVDLIHISLGSAGGQSRRHSVIHVILAAKSAAHALS